MLSKEIAERANRLIEVRFAERRTLLSDEITAVKLRYAAQYLLHSSLTITALKEICAREIDIRAAIAWQALGEALRSGGVASSDDMAEDLKHFMRESINSSFDEITRILNRYLENMMRPEQVSLEEARNNAIANHESEIGLSMKETTH